MLVAFDAQRDRSLLRPDTEEKLSEDGSSKETQGFYMASTLKSINTSALIKKDPLLFSKREPPQCTISGCART